MGCPESPANPSSRAASVVALLLLFCVPPAANALADPAAGPPPAGDKGDHATAQTPGGITSTEAAVNVRQTIDKRLTTAAAGTESIASGAPAERRGAIVFGASEHGPAPTAGLKAFTHLIAGFPIAFPPVDAPAPVAFDPADAQAGGAAFDRQQYPAATDRLGAVIAAFAAHARRAPAWIYERQIIALIAAPAGSPDKALADGAEATSAYPDRPYLALAYGLALDASGNHADAARRFEAAAGSPGCRIGWLYASLANLEMGLAPASASGQPSVPIEDMSTSGTQYTPSNVLASFEAVLKLLSSSAVAGENAPLSGAQDQFLGRAVHDANKVRNAPGIAASALLVRAYVRYRRDDLDGALTDCLAVVARLPQFKVAQDLLSKIRLAQEKHQT